MDNGLCCDPHMAEAREHWVFYAAHSYNPTCSMPGAVFIHAKNVCVVDEDGLGLPQFDTAFMDLALKVVGR